MSRKFENRDLRRKDPGSAAARIAVIKAAEGLFAESGFRSVSIREIANVIGSLNAGIIGYYFGSKEDLIEQIFRYRMIAIDCRRNELLSGLQKSGERKTSRKLLNIIASSLARKSDPNHG